MVSNLLAMLINFRMCELYDGKQIFGGLVMFVLGDLHQLSPVNAGWCFEPLYRSKNKGDFFTFALKMVDLWQKFQFAELTENVRQSGDSSFAEMLDRIRIGSPTEPDIETLNERMIYKGRCASLAESVDTFLRAVDEEPSSVVLYPLNEQVDAFNNLVMQRLKINCVAVQAEDDVPVRQAKKRGRKAGDQKQTKGLLKGRKTSRTAGLEEVLYLGVGARVMLRTNLDQSRGLINGSVGTITSLLSISGNRISTVEVDFSSLNERVKIKRISGDVELAGGSFIRRRQFPLSVAYAMTVHKVCMLVLGYTLLV